MNKYRIVFDHDFFEPRYACVLKFIDIFYYLTCDLIITNDHIHQVRQRAALPASCGDVIAMTTCTINANGEPCDLCNLDSVWNQYLNLRKDVVLCSMHMHL